MDVVVNVGGKIIVDDVRDVGNIQTTSRNSRGNQDRADTVSELAQGLLTLALGAVAVNRVGTHVLVDEEVRQGIGHALGLDEDEGQAAIAVRVQDVEENRALVNVLDVLNLLGDVLRGGANTTNRQEDVVLEEILGEHLNVAGEGGRKHESLAVLGAGHILALNDATNLGLETHVQHAISLVENEVLDAGQRDASTLNEIDKSARGGDEEIAAALDLAELRSYLSTTVDDARADPRAVGKLARLVVDLGDKLASGSKDQRRGVSLALASVATALAGRRGRRAVGESLRQDGEQEATRLAGTGLGASHEVAAADHDGDRVLLNRGRDSVASQVNVGDQMSVEGRSAEGGDGLGGVTAGRSDRNIIVLLEVDAGVLLGRVISGSEELAFGARVGRADDVLAVAPLAIAGATDSVATAAALGSAAGLSANVEVAAVGVGVEATALGATAPAALLLGRGGIKAGAAGDGTGRTSRTRGATGTGTIPVAGRTGTRTSTAGVEVVVAGRENG